MSNGADLISPVTLDEKISPKCCGKHIIYDYTFFGSTARLVCLECKTEVSIHAIGLSLDEAIEKLNNERKIGNTKPLNDFIYLELKAMAREDEQ